MREGTVRVGQTVRTNDARIGVVVATTGIVENGSEWFDVEYPDGTRVMQNAERLRLIAKYTAQRDPRSRKWQGIEWHQDRNGRFSIQGTKTPFQFDTKTDALRAIKAWVR